MSRRKKLVKLNQVLLQSTKLVKGTVLKCRICGVQLKNESNLASHLQRFHDPKYGSRFQCIFCQKSFSMKATFEEHLLLHIEERPHICHVCPQEFRHKCSLKGHLKIHQSDRTRSFKCDICGRTFFTKNTLQDHLPRHVIKKPHECVECGKKFAILADLRKHNESMHEKNVLKNVCVICGKSFSQSGGLTVHIRSHTGERPFKCRVCGYGFIASSHRRKHEKRRHR